MCVWKGCVFTDESISAHSLEDGLCWTVSSQCTFFFYELHRQTWGSILPLKWRKEWKHSKEKLGAKRVQRKTKPDSHIECNGKAKTVHEQDLLSKCRGLLTCTEDIAELWKVMESLRTCWRDYNLTVGLGTSGVCDWGKRNLGWPSKLQWCLPEKVEGNWMNL